MSLCKHLLSSALAMSMGTSAFLVGGSLAIAGDRGEMGGKDHYQHFVKQFDKNKDGTIQLGELPEKMRSHVGPADTNKDGTLSQAEMETFMANNPHHGHGGHGHGMMMMRPEALLSKFDANKDGKLQVAELPEHKREWLSGADTNKDGTLSTDELSAQMVAHKKEWFSKADKNADGALTQSEVDRPGKWERIQKADANKDGKVTMAEMEQAVKSGTLGKDAEHCGHADKPGAKADR